MSQQVYIVTNQPNILTGTHGSPVAAYSDYPSALTYAQSVFRPSIGSEMNARDLIFMIPLTAAATDTATTPAAPTTPTTTTPAPTTSK